MAIYEIPLSPAPSTFLIVLAAKEYRMTITWKDAVVAEPDPTLIAQWGGWVVDIDDADTSEPMVGGIPLVTGADLLAPYGYLGFGGALYPVTSGAPDEVPAFDNLGVGCRLYFFTGDA